MSLQGVLSELEGLTLDDDSFEDPMQSFLQSFGKRYAVDVKSTDDVFRFVDNLRMKKTSTYSKTGAELAFNSIETLLETQMSETRILAEQRNRLVDQLKRMDELCRQSDSLCQNLTDDLSSALQKLKEKTISEPKLEIVKPPVCEPEDPPRIDESYRLLALVHRTFSVIDGPLQAEIDRIKEDSSQTPSDRLVAIAQSGSQAILKSQSDLHSAQEEIENLKSLCNARSQDCVEVLSALEEEVEFIRQLAFNKDLQNIVLYRQLGNRPSLDQEEREELARRCACVGSFIDEKICTLNSSEICERLESYGVKEPTGIFELMKGTDTETKVRKILISAEEHENTHVRTVTDLLLAQVLMNEILRNYALELGDRVTDIMKFNQKLDKMRAEKEDLANQLDMKGKEFLKLRKKAVNFKKLIDKILKLTKGEDPCTFIKELQRDLKSVTQLAAERKSISREETVSQSECEEEEIRAGEVSYKEDFERITVENNQLKETVEAGNRRVEELMQDKLALQQEIRTLAQEKEDVETIKTNLEASITQVTKLQNELKECETVKTTLIQEKSALESEIKKIESLHMQGIEDIKTKCAELRADMEKKVNQIEKLNAEKQIWTKTHEEQAETLTKLQSEVDELTVANKSLTLKLKAVTDNAELEKQSLLSQLSAAQTSSQSQLDKLEKECAKKISDYEANILLQIKAVVGETRMSDITVVLNKLSTELQDLRRLQKTYASLIEDISNVQTLLQLQPHEKLSEHINVLMKECERLRVVSSRCKEELARKEQDISTARKEISRLQGCAAVSRQWETWAKRILKVIRNCRCSDMSGEQLRLTLEELLLSSVSNRVMFSRIETLKREKQLLTKFNRRAFTTKSVEMPTWNSVLLAVVALRRLEKLVGGFTVNVNDI